MSPDVSSALGWITTWTHGDCVVAIRTVSEVRMLASRLGLSDEAHAALVELERELFLRLDRFSPEPPRKVPLRLVVLKEVSGE
jgi:hypothetical protein